MGNSIKWTNKKTTQSELYLVIDSQMDTSTVTRPIQLRTGCKPHAGTALLSNLDSSVHCLSLASRQLQFQTVSSFVQVRHK